MIVPLDTLKKVLGIPLDPPADPSVDETLTGLIDAATAWVEGETHRRFSPPASKTEYRLGAGKRVLYLRGHISEDADHPEYSVMAVSERVMFGDWELLADTEYERHDSSIIRTDGAPWFLGVEYKIVYMDGYVTAPLDIQALIIELASGQSIADTAVSTGANRLQSETLVGVYSYTISSTAGVIGGAPGGGSISYVGQRTLNRYQKKFI
jgi:hypothetical protein